MHPKCCNKRATPYRRTYRGDSTEDGFRCKRCGRIRLPFLGLDVRFVSAEEYEAVRMEGIKFDESLHGTGNDKQTVS